MVILLHRTFVDRARVRAAIERAEARTDARITVTLGPRVRGSLVSLALRELNKRGARGTAVHFHVIPARREFAVVGNVEAHERIGSERWKSIVSLLETYFSAGEPTAALIAGIEEIGDHLARHFPRV